MCLAQPAKITHSSVSKLRSQKNDKPRERERVPLPVIVFWWSVIQFQVFFFLFLGDLKAVVL
jgi:hypothetical protein